MDKHLIFLDIDGTLVGFDTKIPASTEKAIKQAQANGHEVFICTGRPRGIVYDFLLDWGFDGIVSSTGALIEYHDEVVLEDQMSPSMFTKMITTVDYNNTPVIVNCHDKCVMRSTDIIPMCERLSSSMCKTDNWQDTPLFKSLDPLAIDDDLETYPERYHNITAINYVNCKKTVDQLSEELGSDFNVTIAAFTEPDVSCGEVTIGRHDKGTAIDVMCEKLNVPLKNTIAIGDGGNDLAMLKRAGVGVAMGNAGDFVKKAADMVTTDVDKDGIANALTSLNII